MPDYAIYAEHSDSKKPMMVSPPPSRGWNVRAFNRKEVQEGHSISLDEKTGAIHLDSGTYHITASSQVTYDSAASSTDGTMVTKPNPFGGYCRLRHASDPGCPNEKAIAIGTIGNANMIPSMVETYLKVETEASIVLEHQVGNDLKGIYLQVYAGQSSWHVFARISIKRL